MTTGYSTETKSPTDDPTITATLAANAADLISGAEAFTSIPQLVALVTAEKAGKNRSTVIAAYEARIEELRNPAPAAE